MPWDPVLLVKQLKGLRAQHSTLSSARVASTHALNAPLPRAAPLQVKQLKAAELSRRSVQDIRAKWRSVLVSISALPACTPVSPTCRLLLQW